MAASVIGRGRPHATTGRDPVDFFEDSLSSGAQNLEKAVRLLNETPPGVLIPAAQAFLYRGQPLDPKTITHFATLIHFNGGDYCELLETCKQLAEPSAKLAKIPTKSITDLETTLADVIDAIKQLSSKSQGTYSAIVRTTTLKCLEILMDCINCVIHNHLTPDHRSPADLRPMQVALTSLIQLLTEQGSLKGRDLDVSNSLSVVSEAPQIPLAAQDVALLQEDVMKAVRSDTNSVFMLENLIRLLDFALAPPLKNAEEAFDTRFTEELPQAKSALRLLERDLAAYSTIEAGRWYNINRHREFVLTSHEAISVINTMPRVPLVTPAVQALAQGGMAYRKGHSAEKLRGQMLARLGVAGSELGCLLGRIEQVRSNPVFEGTSPRVFILLANQKLARLRDAIVASKAGIDNLIQTYSELEGFDAVATALDNALLRIESHLCSGTAPIGQPPFGVRV